MAGVLRRPFPLCMVDGRSIRIIPHWGIAMISPQEEEGQEAVSIHLPLNHEEEDGEEEGDVAPPLFSGTYEHVLHLSYLGIESILLVLSSRSLGRCFSEKYTR